MKLGLLPTGVLRSRVDFAEMARFAADNGYRAIDVMVDRPEAVEVAAALGLEVGQVGLVPPLVFADEATREVNVRAAIARLDAVASMGGRLVGLGHARVPDATDDENVEYFRLGVAPVAEHAEKLGIKLVMENYPNYGKNLAISPSTIRRLFAAVPSPAVGLCYDPSHFVFLGIDYLRALRELGGRILYAHAKDTEIVAEGLYQLGILAGPTFGRKPVNGPGWWRYCLPGCGAVNWGAVLSALREVGYDGVVSLEHEDDLWGWRDDVEKAKRGLVVARKYLDQFMG